MTYHRSRLFFAVACLSLPAFFGPGFARGDDAPSTQPADALLGNEFRSSTTGIAFRPPADSKKLLTPIPDQIVEFDNDARHWVFKARWTTLKNSTPLVGFDDPVIGHRDGILDEILEDIQKQPSAQVLDKEVIHIGPDGKIPVATVIVRYDQGLTTRLMQQAIIQANDRLYYVLQLDCPGHPGGQSSAGNDPDEQLAFDTFSHVVDSVALLDREQIYRDQVDRLIRTRSLFVNWTEPFLRRQLVPERYFRILRDGRDIGYSYQAQTLDDGDGRIANTDVVKLNILTHTMENGRIMDANSTYAVTVDRKHEEWIATANTSGTADGKPVSGSYHEVGISDWRIRAVPAAAPGEGLDPKAAEHPEDAMGQPGVKMEDQYTLTVSIKSAQASLPKFEQRLPAYYIPQGFEQMLPQLLPYKDSKTYMFATYVSNGDNGRPAIMSEYADVQPAQDVELGGNSLVAVPIQVRLGLDGPITSYYVNADDGSYLGSSATVADADGTTSKVEVIPSDLDTLKKIWPAQVQPSPAAAPPAAPTPAP